MSKLKVNEDGSVTAPFTQRDLPGVPFQQEMVDGMPLAEHMSIKILPCKKCGKPPTTGGELFNIRMEDGEVVADNICVDCSSHTDAIRDAFDHWNGEDDEQG